MSKNIFKVPLYVIVTEFCTPCNVRDFPPSGYVVNCEQSRAVWLEVDSLHTEQLIVSENQNKSLFKRT